MRKTILILAVLLVFVYGIFGIPKGISLDAWKTALTDRIHLGLDLKGGTHLVLQVMADEALGAVTDNRCGTYSNRLATRRLCCALGIEARPETARIDPGDRHPCGSRG